MSQRFQFFKINGTFYNVNDINEFSCEGGKCKMKRTIGERGSVEYWDEKEDPKGYEDAKRYEMFLSRKHNSMLFHFRKEK